MFELTTSEAAELLSISTTRVLQLIRNGALPAEKIGGIWLVDRDAVLERRDNKPEVGRPSRKKRSQTYTLMNRTHEVLTFDYDPETGSFLDVYDIRDATRAPLSVVSPRGKRASQRALEVWWSNRAIPGNRAGLTARLEELGVSRAAELPFSSLGLSLSDQYWVKPHNTDVKWEDINFFENSFQEMTADAWLSEVGLDSPDNTSDGMLPKAWIRKDAIPCLVKGGGILNQEPYNEVVATDLYRRLLKPNEFVPYEIIERGATIASLCADFISNDEEFIPAYYVRKTNSQTPHHDAFRHYIECCAKLGVTDVEDFLQKMIVCDDIIANTDRHWRNFGLIRNVETLEYRVAPLFDSGTSLWCHVRTSEMAHSSYAFDSKPFRDVPNDQLRLVSDFSWLDSAKLAGFAEAAADILEENPLMSGRIDFVYNGIQSRIDHLLRLID